jgi:hypothetical protein
MFLGVPLLVIVLGGIGSLILAGTLAIFVSPWAALVCVGAFTIFCIWARTVTTFDDWRLLQLFQRQRLRPSKGNFSRFGGVSYAPYKLQKR